MDKEKMKKEVHNTKTYYSTLSSKNQITVPAVIREKLEAYPGDQISFSVDEDNRLIVDIIKKDALLSLYGSMPPKGSAPQKNWDEIREESRIEKINSNHDEE